MKPIDPAMPFLERALDLAEAEAALARLPQHVSERVRLEAARLIRHKPGRRAVIEYVVHCSSADAQSGRRVLIGKARAKGLDAKSFRLTSQLAEEFEYREPIAVRVPRPYAILPEFNMWLQEKVLGEPATSFLFADNGTAVCAGIAAAAHKIHRSSVSPLRTHSVEDEMTILTERLRAVAGMNPPWAERIEHLLEQCRRLALTLAAVAPCPVHRDFHPGQILVDPERLWILDFDLFSLGDPAVDVGNFIAHITELSLRQTGDAARYVKLERALEDGYVALAGESIRPRIHIYALLSLARHIHISTQFEERKAFTGRLLDWCEARLAGAS